MEEEELPTGADGPDGSRSPGEIPALPPEVSERAQEVRSLVDAGAASPEESRALAAKLKEQRLLEESAWKREVKPALIESKKVRFSIGDLRQPSADDHSYLGLGLVLFGLVAGMIVVATQTSFLWLLVPVLAVFFYAWRQGRSPEGAAAPPPPPPADPAD